MAVSPAAELIAGQSLFSRLLFGHETQADDAPVVRYVHIHHPQFAASWPLSTSHPVQIGNPIGINPVGESGARPIAKASARSHSCVGQRMKASSKHHLNFAKSLQPTPEAAKSRLARLRRRQRLLLHDRKLAKLAKQLALSSSPGSLRGDPKVGSASPRTMVILRRLGRANL
jgi:hypothetical protein